MHYGNIKTKVKEYDLSTTTVNALRKKRGNVALWFKKKKGNYKGSFCAYVSYENGIDVQLYII